MIITIKGASGAGKSHLVRRIMQRYTQREARYVAERKRPLWYDLGPLAVLGHYETACGGCDTITETDTTFSVMRDRVAAGQHVLYEGLLLAVDVNRIKAMAATTPVHVIFLDTSLQACLDSINQRRAARGVTEPVNPENTRSKWEAMPRVEQRLQGVPNLATYRVNREDAFALVCGLLGI